MMYKRQFPAWPDFVYAVDKIQTTTLDLAEETGEVNVMIKGLSDEFQQETLLQLMISEAINTSQIEGEFVSREDVMSSVRNNLGLNELPVHIKDQRAGGVAQLMVEVRSSFKEPIHLDAVLR